MYNRADDITDATDGTFDWLLTNEPASPNANTHRQTSGSDVTNGLERWLEIQEHQKRQQNAAKISDFFEQSSGVLFMRGKPGSGKSTLMKHLSGGRGQPKVHQKVRKWAGQKKLVCISTMFLLHGTPLQRSLEGFYRTVFFEIIRQFPDLVQVLFPRDSARELPDDSYRSSFRLKTLKDAWTRLISVRNHTKLRICVFIDGLDELEGNSRDRLDFARSLRDWAQSDDIKIICSGRPNAELNIVFNQPQRCFDLQDLPKPDIRKILWKRFEELRQYSDLTEENLETLVNDISDQSEGVILYAVLVGKNLEDDIIHRKPFGAIKSTIRALPRGIEDFFNDMWQDVRHDAHQQLMLRTIYELLVLTQERLFSNRLLGIFLSWLEDVLSDDEFPYNESVQALPFEELNSRFDKVRDQLVQYTGHLIEVTTVDKIFNDFRFNSGSCRFIHRSAQEFIQAKLVLIGSAPAPSDRTFELYLRLQLIYRIRANFRHSETDLHFLFELLSWYNREWRPHRPQPQRVYQVPYRMMERVRELSGASNGSRLSFHTGHEHWYYQWRAMKLSWIPSIGELSSKKTVGAYSFFHLALQSHQVDYATRILNRGTQQLDREALSLGLLICVAGERPSYELFKLLVEHGADPGSLVEVYRPERESTPERIPLWLLFCLSLAVKVPTNRSNMKDEFLILERLLGLGFGFNVRFLTFLPDMSIFPKCWREMSIGFLPELQVCNDKTGEDGLLGMDFAQIVRIAKPDNLDRLLCLLEPPLATRLSLLQGLTNWVLHAQFPVNTLSQGACVRPLWKVWDVWSAFTPEHEVRGGSHYYIPQ